MTKNVRILVIGLDQNHVLPLVRPIESLLKREDGPVVSWYFRSNLKEAVDFVQSSGKCDIIYMMNEVNFRRDEMVEAAKKIAEAILGHASAPWVLLDQSVFLYLNKIFSPHAEHLRFGMLSDTMLERFRREKQCAA